MTDTIVVISRDDTFMHVGPPTEVAHHLFGDQGHVLLLPPAGDGPETHVAAGLRFGDLDTYDEAGRALEWSVDRYLRPQRVHAVPDLEPDPEGLLQRMRSVVAHLNAEIAARPDLLEFRDAFYAERLISPPDLTTAVNTFADLGRPRPRRMTAAPPRRLPDSGLPHDLTTRDLHPLEPADPPPDVGTIPHSGSWFHNLMHRIAGS
jgi:hypothetical protein